MIREINIGIENKRIKDLQHSSPEDELDRLLGDVSPGRHARTVFHSTSRVTESRTLAKTGCSGIIGRKDVLPRNGSFSDSLPNYHRPVSVKE
jgi:hypothetical protein